MEKRDKVIENMGAVGKTLDISFHTRPPKWCPILEAKKKGL